MCVTYSLILLICYLGPSLPKCLVHLTHRSWSYGWDGPMTQNSFSSFKSFQVKTKAKYLPIYAPLHYRNSKYTNITKTIRDVLIWRNRGHLSILTLLIHNVQFFATILHEISRCHLYKIYYNSSIYRYTTRNRYNSWQKIW